MATLQATRQTRPLLDGNPAGISWAGVAFANDGTLYVANNSSPSRYYAYDPATGNLTQGPQTTANSSRDLASCAFPIPAEPELSVTKTLALVNGIAYVAGSPVGPGDTLTYQIEIENTGGAVATLFPGDVVETLPASTSVVTTGNDFICSGSNCPNANAVNVAANDSVVLNFVVLVDDPLPASVTSIDNAVTVEGIDCAEAGNDCDESTPLRPAVTVAKSADPASGTAVAVGQTITYTLTVDVANAALLSDVVVTDTLGTGLELGTVTAPDFSCNTSNPLACTLLEGTGVGTYTVVYTATVTADATTSVANSVEATGGNSPDDPNAPDPDCTSCSTEHPVNKPAVTVAKVANPASGTAVTVGQAITYTLTVDVANAALLSDVVVTDTLGTGLELGTVTAPDFSCNTSNPLACTLLEGTGVGTYTVVYTTTVTADATTSVANSAEATGGNSPDDPNAPDPDCTSCSTEHPVNKPEVTVAKSANPTSGQSVTVGQVITYTLTVDVANAALLSDVVVTDTLGTGLELGTVTAPDFSCNTSNPLACTLLEGTGVGTYTVVYTATVTADATTSVANSVEATGGNSPDDPNAPDPDCTSCSTEHPVNKPTVTVAKSADPASGTAVTVGQTITYTLTVDVTNAPTLSDVLVTDTLGTGLSLGTVTAPGFSCGTTNPLACALPSGTAPGSYLVTYEATVTADATTSVANSVTASGGNSPDDPNAPDPDCTSCSTEHPVNKPEVTVAKAADPASGTAVTVGQTITYTLTVDVANAPTLSDVVLTDTLGTGLSLGTVTAPGFSCGTTNPLACTLPSGTAPGSYLVTYEATVTADATTSVANSVTASGGNSPDDPNAPDPDCTSCSTEHPVNKPEVTVAKSADPASGTAVTVGQTITYTLTVDVANAATLSDVVLTDTLGTGLSLDTASLPAGCSAAGQTVTCTLVAGAAIDTYTFAYTATVTADATTAVANSVEATGGNSPDDPNAPDPDCTSCSTEHPVNKPAVTVAKSADPASGTAVTVGQTITYTLTVDVANAPTLSDVVVTDTLGTGLSLGTVTAPDFSCNTSNPLACTLPLGTAPGSYVVTYTATVTADATTSVANSVTASGGNSPDDPNAPDPDCTSCSTEHPVNKPTVTVAKSADPASGTAVTVGQVITYTLTVDVANAALLSDVVVTDTLGTGLALGTVTAPDFDCNATNPLVCTLPVGTAPGSYVVTYEATVTADATTSVANSVEATGGNSPDDPNAPDPDCTSCSTEHPVNKPAVTVAKSADPASGTAVTVGQAINYTLTVDVANAALLSDVVVTDTLGTGLELGTVTAPGFSCNATNPLACTLPSGTAPGSYVVTYEATVTADATTSVANSVTATGGNSPDDPNAPAPDCTSCTTEHPVDKPVVRVSKSANPVDGTEVQVNDVIEYTLTVTVENAATLSPVRLVDTPDAGLTIGALPAGCATSGGDIVCVLEAGALPGIHTFVYPATVNADAAGDLGNVVVASYDGGVPNVPEPECTTCETSHKVVDTTALRIVKTAGSRYVKTGDLVRYTLTVENVGDSNVVDGTVVDTPAPGFSYVDGSMTVADTDGAFTLASSQSPLRIGGLDIPVGRSATIVYLMRVGAGVKPGVHINQAVAVNDAGTPVSNVATAQVTLDTDPLLDDSLIFGTVFDDRDGDGWQDSAALSGVRVQGGFAPAAYVANSTTVDRGQGHQSEPDASSPLLHGIAVGGIAGRQSVADPVDAHQVVIRQVLSAPEFTGDFVLTSDQGVTVRMDADGNTRVEQDGEAARGLTAAEPTVERRVARTEAGYVVDYVITNAGIDERGIPGVRIASVEGLLIETDQYGRYHLVDVWGGDWGHGRNFILKVDPATLPPGTGFTTPNPLVRRVTPGLPVRFDFGVQLPVQQIEGGTERVELELGEVIFEPGSAVVRPRYLPAIEAMAAQVNRYGGGEVVIVADGGSEALAFARAAAVRDALQVQVDESARGALTVALRTNVADPHSLVAGVDADGALLGTVLFDTDRSAIRPEFNALLDQVAQRLEALGGGVIGIVGHTDVRGSHQYNVGLGLRRATAVYEAIRNRLSPEVRNNVRVESSSDPTAPVGVERE
nr:isopeptide-forming domain-containing fimbrial protein [Luteimonas sp. BDR2-5]